MASTNDERPPAPPGWYPHPGGGQRYWDGTAWLETPPVDAPASPPASGPKKPDKLAAGCGLGCGGLILLAGIVLIFGALFGDDDEDDGGGEYGARDVCQQFVKDRLKSPGSADFSGERATEESDGSWTVRGDVDSENSFGASIRNSYVCKVRHATGDTWKLIDLQSTEN